jgi:hypothetical protein
LKLSTVWKADAVNTFLNNDTSLSPTKRTWYDLDEVIRRSNDCKNYFNTFPILGANDGFVEAERSILLDSQPLAYSHLVHRDVSVLEVFLSLYFRPNNFHCIHVDKNADDLYKNAINNLIQCYSLKVKNGAIFTLSDDESVSVKWGSNTMLEADMKCLKKLLQYTNGTNISWNYVFSVAGSELPIVTYSTFVKKLKQQLHPSFSAVESFLLPEGNLIRIPEKQMKNKKHDPDNLDANIFELPNPLLGRTSNISSQQSKELRNGSITFKVFKGIRNVILSSNDADFVINSPVAKKIFDWMQLGTFTEELFYATVIRFRVDSISKTVIQNTTTDILSKNSGGIAFTSGDTLHGICPRYTSWGCLKCFGKCINAICNFHMMDLDKIKGDDTTDCLVANKFNLDVDPMAVTQHWINILQKVSRETRNAFKNKWEVHSVYWKNIMEKVFLVTSAQSK